MPELSQGEFGRAARGVAVIPGVAPDVEWFVLGMISSCHCAIREVHSETAAIATATFAAKMSKFLLQGGGAAATATGLRACLRQYVEWDGGDERPAAAMPTKGIPIAFAPGDVVRARPDVVLGPADGPGEYEARAVLLDDIALDRRAAEMIGLPIVGYVEARFGPESAAMVEVWHLARGERERVTAAEAEAHRGEVEALLASL